MIIDRELIQGTDEWFAARVGSPGASGFDKIITSTGKRSTQRKKYMYQLAGELLAGEKESSYSTPAMTRGVELEPEARETFEKITGLEVEQVGIIYPDDFLRNYHVSPDGLIVNENKGLEIKCPLAATHIEYLDKGELPTKYKLQVQGSLMITGYETWYFMSYHPKIRPLILEVPRDEKLIEIMRAEIELFCVEVAELAERLRCDT